jgi:hypothetical protein
LVEETGVPGENLSQVTDKLYHIMLYTSPSRFELTPSVVIGTDCIDRCKSNYHMIMAMTIPSFMFDCPTVYKTFKYIDQSDNSSWHVFDLKYLKN